ncbi:MAG: hypothetical protein FWH44_03230 [Methanomassiliicoccaceae archaeon]|nr:hypothetical protein [Methanomassiliicoccaceae archaeon]
MAKGSVKGRDYVRIASYLFFDKYKKDKNEEVPGVIYNKFITLLHRDLRPEIDIKLPHCWYRWGDIVVSHCVPYVKWVHKGPRYTVVEWNDDAVKYDPNDKTVSLIKKNIAEFMIRHSGSEAHETARDEVYDGAPFEFQNEYRKLRESLESLSKNKVMDNQAEYINGLFAAAMSAFPGKEFKQIANEKERFEAVFRMGLKNNASSRDLFDLTELFWFFFCYHLRVNKRCHENIAKETLNIWMEEIPWETMRMEHFLQNFAKDFHDGEDNPLIVSLLEERRKRMEEIDDFISVMCADAHGGRIGRV